MAQDEEQAIVSFLRGEALRGHFESTTMEIAGGVKLSYNQVARILERLILMANIGFRERGTERKTVRYFFVKDIQDLYQRAFPAADA